MDAKEIRVGAIYRLGGQYRRLKQVVAYDPAGRYSGGTVVTANVVEGGCLRSEETLSGEYFAKRVIERISADNGE